MEALDWTQPKDDPPLYRPRNTFFSAQGSRGLPGRASCVEIPRAHGQSGRDLSHERSCRKIPPEFCSEGRETKETIDASDRTSAWIRRFPSLPASTAYIHYPPYPYPKVPCSGLGMVYCDEKKKWRRVTADDIASAWP